MIRLPLRSGVDPACADDSLIVGDADAPFVPGTIAPTADPRTHAARAAITNAARVLTGSPPSAPSGRGVGRRRTRSSICRRRVGRRTARC